jgi:hypothetical protein
MPIQVIRLVVAYVLITTATGKEGSVLDHLRKLPGLSEVHQLFGQFDMIVRMERRTTMFSATMSCKIHFPGITSTRTLISARFKR